MEYNNLDNYLDNNLNYTDIFCFTIYDWCSTGMRYLLGLNLYKPKLKIKGLSLFKTPIFEYPFTMYYLYLNEKDINNNTLFFIKQHTPYYHIYITKKNIYYNLLKNSIENTKIIYLHAETYLELEDYNYHDKIIITGVSGNPYRRNPNEYSQFFNKFINKSLIQCPDLLNLGLKNEHLIYYGVNTEYIKQFFDIKHNIYKKNRKLIVGHFSSNPKTKGSDIIIQSVEKVVNKYPNKIEYIGYKKNDLNHTKKWIDNLYRMYHCDIYIETCKLVLDDKVYKEYNNTIFGEWGNTCLEAASLGVIVITNTLTKEYYTNEYTNEYPLLIANNSKEIIDHLIDLINMDYCDIVKLKKKYYNWIKKNHTLKKTGKRFYSKLIEEYENLI